MSAAPSTKNRGGTTANAERAVSSAEQAADNVVNTAEQTVEEVSAKVARWVSTFVARAREEAEDIWAEARAKQRGR